MGTKAKPTAGKKTKAPAKKTEEKKASTLLFKERLFLQDLVGQKVNVETAISSSSAYHFRAKVLNVDLNAGVVVLRGLTADQVFFKKTVFVPIDRAILSL